MGQRSQSVCVLVFGLAACHGSGGGGGGSGVTMTTLKPTIGLDLTHLIGFAIAGTGSSNRLAFEAPASEPDAGTCTPMSTLYAVMDNGDMVVTTVSEDTGSGSGSSTCSSVMMTETATAIFDTPNYDVIDYSNPGLLLSCDGGACNICTFVVMRKSDGALFCGAGDQAGAPRRVEGTGDVLYLGGSPNGLSRLDMTVDPPHVTIVDDPSVTMDQISTFDVNAANDALTAGSFGVRVFKANGGLQNISATGESFQWLSPAGSFYYGAGAQATAGTPGGLRAYELAAGSYTPTLVGFSSITIGGSNSGGFALATASQAYRWAGEPTIGLVELLATGSGACWASSPTACTSDLQCSGTCTNNYCQNGPKTSYPCIGPSDCADTCDIAAGTCHTDACTTDAQCNATCTLMPNAEMRCAGGSHSTSFCATDADCLGTCMTAGTQHPVTGMTMIKNALGVGNAVFLQGTDVAGNGTVAKMDVPAFTQTTLLPAGDYTLTAIAASKTGELSFTGLRNSDGASVLGNCTPTCTVLNATAPVVRALQRIN